MSYQRSGDVFVVDVAEGVVVDVPSLVGEAIVSEVLDGVVADF